MEKHRRNFELLRNYEEILKTFPWNFSKIAKKTLKKKRSEHLALLFKLFDRNVVKCFARQFSKQLVKNCRKNMKLFWENFGYIRED